MDEGQRAGVGRRALLKKATVGTAVVWATPVVAAAPAVGASGSPPPDDCSTCAITDLRISHVEEGPPGEVVATFTARARIACDCERRVRYQWACLPVPGIGADCTADPNGGRARQFQVPLTTCPTTVRVTVTISVTCGAATCSATLSRSYVYDGDCAFVVDP